MNDNLSYNYNYNLRNPYNQGILQANQIIIARSPGTGYFFNQFLAPEDSPAANVTSRHVVGEGPGAIPWDSAFLSLADC